MIRLPPLLVIAALAPMMTGCVAVAAAGVVGVGYVQYERNEVEADFREDLDHTWCATLDAVRELGVHSPTADLGSTEGTIEFDDVCVRVERHAEGFTRVRVRVGTFHTADHRRRAELLVQQVRDRMHAEDGLREWTDRIRELDETPPEGSSTR